MLSKPNPSIRYGLIVLLALTSLFYPLFFSLSITPPATLAILVLLGLMVLFLFYKLCKTSARANEKSRFLANMSHEIRTSLNSVIGFSEQLGQTNLDENQNGQLKAIQASSMMLLELVNDILDFSKYETYKVNFNKTPFILLATIHEVVNSMSIQALNKGIELRTEISVKDTVCLSGDPLRLKQVLMNLLSNAIKFTQKGSVTLRAEVIQVDHMNSTLKVQVVDTGVGINNEDLDKIFDEFAQLNHGQLKSQGTGLGLAICKKIVEFQNGKIEVASELGKGSIFTFSIPYEVCDKRVLVNNNPPLINASNLQGKRVLIVDDLEMNILLVQTVLHKYKVITDFACNGRKAYELFEKNEYDLVLTDIEMPIMNGIALTNAIRLCSDDTKQNIPIFGVTANVMPEDRAFYLDAGMNNLVLKPFLENDMIEKIAAEFTP